MKTFISENASKYLKQVAETIEQQEALLSSLEKAKFPFWKRAVDTATQVYYANKLRIDSLGFAGTVAKGYSLTVNNETCSFLIERKEASHV